MNDPRYGQEPFICQNGCTAKVEALQAKVAALEDKVIDRTDASQSNGKLADELAAENKTLRERVAELEGLTKELTDPDPCRYDHHGYCQAHALHEKPCPHERSKQLLEQSK